MPGYYTFQATDWQSITSLTDHRNVFLYNFCFMNFDVIIWTRVKDDLDEPFEKLVMSALVRQRTKKRLRNWVSSVKFGQSMYIDLVAYFSKGGLNLMFVNRNTTSCVDLARYQHFCAVDEQLRVVFSRWLRLVHCGAPQQSCFSAIIIVLNDSKIFSWAKWHIDRGLVLDSPELNGHH